MRRAKIVATVGPKSCERDSLHDLLLAGVDVFRLNLAHADRDTHEKSAALIREVSAETGRVPGILADLPGPKMRTGPVVGDMVVLEAGTSFVLTGADATGDEHHVSTTVPDLPAIVELGDEVFLADGAIVLKVTSIEGDDVHTEIVRRGVLRSRKGMHLPAAERHVRAFTPEDEDALGFALSIKADFVGLSFIRDAQDLDRARDALPKRGPRPGLVGKIETRSALDNLDGIVRSADAVMVARGDLGIQTALTRVPMIQKEIIELCNQHGTPVITATQMLESMTQSPLPTRAEVADVANAVLDGTDALMLSEETAVGEHPVTAVQTMAEIAHNTEAGWQDRPLRHVPHVEDGAVSWAVAHAAVQAATDLGVRAILCPTRSGATPRRVAAFRPRMPVIGLSSRRETLGALNLIWGVVALPMVDIPDVNDMRADIEHVIRTAHTAGLCLEGELVVVVAGTPGRRAGRTDFMRVVRV